MSQENLQVARSALEAFNRRDLHASLAAMDPDVDFTPFAGELVDSFHGHEDVRRWWAELSRVFSALRYELIEARDLGDRALATLQAHGVSKGSPSIRPSGWSARFATRSSSGGTRT